MNNRVAWVLLFTYVVQLVLGGFGIWVSVQISGKDVGPPSPPTTTTAPLTTLPPSRRWNSYENSQDRPSEEYRNYMETTRHYANYDENPTLYLIIPWGVAVMIAAVLIVGGICSRKTFSTTTTGLYSSLGLWIVVFLITMQYQSVEWKPDDNFLSTLGLVIGMQVGLLLLLASQIALAVWDLRRQKTGWPCINPTHLFTVEMILLITRLTLGVYVIQHLSYSEMIRGLSEHSSWESSRVRFPEYYVLPCIIAALYGLIVSCEGILSQLFGKMHNRLMCCTTLISAICYAALAVVASPVFVRAVIGPYRMRQEVMVFASISSIVNFLHAIACLAFPSGVRAPPPYIRTIANHLLPMGFSSNGFYERAAFSSSAAMSSAALTLRSKFRRNNTLCCNIISSTLSLLAIILLSIGAGSYHNPNWSGIMMLCVDVAVFCRSMPEAVTELVYHRFQDTNLLKSLHLNLENLFLFTASIGAFFTWSPAVQVVSGFINLPIVIVQTIRVMHYFSGQNKGIATDGEDTKPLKEAELETAQELSDDEHSGPPESLA